jgi:hypothetical protein
MKMLCNKFVILKIDLTGEFDLTLKLSEEFKTTIKVCPVSSSLSMINPIFCCAAQGAKASTNTAVCCQS